MTYHKKPATSQVALHIRIIALVAIPGLFWLTGCRTKPSVSQVNANAPVTSDRIFDANGRLVQESIDNSGQLAAGQGVFRDNNGTDAIKALAPGFTSQGKTYFRFLRTSRREGNQSKVQEATEQRNSAFEAVASAISGTPQAAAAVKALSIAEDVLSKAIAESNAPATPHDDSTVLMEMLSDAPDHTRTIESAAASFERAVVASYGARPQVANSSSNSFEDTTSPELLAPLADVAKAKIESDERIKIAQLKADEQRAAIDKLNKQIADAQATLDSTQASVAPAKGERPAGMSPTEWAKSQYPEKPVEPDNNQASHPDTDKWQLKGAGTNTGTVRSPVPNKWGRLSSMVLTGVSGISETLTPANGTTIANGNRLTYTSRHTAAEFGNTLSSIVATTENGYVHTLRNAPANGNEKFSTWETKAPAPVEPQVSLPPAPSTSAVEVKGLPGWWEDQANGMLIPDKSVANKVLRAGLVHDDLSDGIPNNGLPKENATDVGGIWALTGPVTRYADREGWLVNMDLSYDGPVTERRTSDWHNIVILDGRLQ